MQLCAPLWQLDLQMACEEAFICHVCIIDVKGLQVPAEWTLLIVLLPVRPLFQHRCVNGPLLEERREPKH